MAKNTSSIRKTGAVKRRTTVKTKVTTARAKRDPKSGKLIKAVPRSRTAAKKTAAKKPAAKKTAARKRAR